jgi:hypothetical protein
MPRIDEIDHVYIDDEGRCFPFCGPPDDRIYSLGSCAICGVAMIGERPEPVEICEACARVRTEER